MTPLRGLVRVPGDKSIAHRACLLAALGSGRSEIRGLSGGGDNTSTLRCLMALGVGVEPRGVDGRSVAIDGVGLRGLRAPVEPLDCGNSGTTMRLLIGILAGQTGGQGDGLSFVLTGDDSLRRRPMNRVAKPMRLLGARIELPQGDHPPVVVTPGPLVGVRCETGVASAQVKSALLLAGLQAHGRTVVSEPVPTRDHTERMLRGLGVAVEVSDGEIALIGCEALPAADWDVPGDPSSAAFFVAAALLVPGSRVELPDVCVNPRRTGFLTALGLMGARVELRDVRLQGGEPVGTIVAEYGPLRGLALDPARVPSLIDELPLLALLAATAEGETTISGAAELAVKESDRIVATAELLRQAGAEVEIRPDGWHLGGGLRPRGGFVAACHHDHRIAMCAAILSLACAERIAPDNPEAIAVSSPTSPAPWPA